ncbi:hypothetical protein Godav_005060 [Gossypium davidsonii]|uniref:Uncharacterized protein n=1 Tax=Gossypium davidsonii TaxID=34287 RepID=A0A7J8SNC2_GOSDV|nr:hypothetical protein [Gossypium davidsonii]
MAQVLNLNSLGSSSLFTTRPESSGFLSINASRTQHVGRNWSSLVLRLKCNGRFSCLFSDNRREWRLIHSGENYVKGHPFGVKQPLNSSVLSPGWVGTLRRAQGPEEAVGASVHRWSSTPSGKSEVWSQTTPQQVSIVPEQERFARLDLAWLGDKSLVRSGDNIDSLTGPLAPEGQHFTNFSGRSRPPLNIFNDAYFPIGLIFAIHFGTIQPKTIEEQARKALESALGGKKTEFEKWNKEIKRREEAGGGDNAGGGGWFGWGGRFGWSNGDHFWQEAQQASLAILGIIVMYLVIAKGELLLAVIFNPLLYALRGTRDGFSYVTSKILGNGPVDSSNTVNNEAYVQVSAKESVLRKWGSN